MAPLKGFDAQPPVPACSPNFDIMMEGQWKKTE
jgi:hypothetical protein